MSPTPRQLLIRLRDWLVENGIGTAPSAGVVGDIFLQQLPDKVEEGIVIELTGGPLIASDPTRRPTVQLQVRNKRKEEALNTVTTIAQLIHNQWNVLYRFPGRLTLAAPPGAYFVDSSGRAVYFLNLTLTTTRQFITPIVANDGYNPFYDSELLAWWDADDADTLSLSGSDVSGWSSKIGSLTLTAIDSTSPTREYISEIGRYAVSFPTTSARLSANQLPTGISTGNPHPITIMGVLEAIGDNGASGFANTAFLFSSDPDDPSISTSLLFADETLGWQVYRNGFTGTGGVPCVYGTRQVVTGVSRHASATVWAGNTQAISSAVATVSGLTTTQMGRSGTGFFPYYGRIMELMVWGGEFTYQDLTTRRQYLSSRWRA